MNYSKMGTGVTHPRHFGACLFFASAVSRSVLDTFFAGDRQKTLELTTHTSIKHQLLNIQHHWLYAFYFPKFEIS
jgi:hypothetical protein